MNFLLDTNYITALLKEDATAFKWFGNAKAQGAVLGICLPVIYEVERGLIWKNARRQLATLKQHIIPYLDEIAFTELDWMQAARFWADTRSKGYLLSDIDLLIAALAQRLDLTIVSRDKDFDRLPIRRDEW